MKIILLSVGKTEKGYLEEGCQVFYDRLKHYVKFESLELDVSKKITSLPVSERKIKEGELIQKHLEQGDFVVLLDEKGKEYSSRQFADFLQKQMASGIKRLVFVVGGAFGFSDQIYGLANAKISFSKMTFSHQMIRLFMVEQLYRGFTILKNEPYHND
jgi:23S rRNA (pseudouridine1915-N3)-methyltransferase